MTPGQNLPADYSKGDERTVGGYAAVHARPAALEGRDGLSYSLEVVSDTTEEAGPDRQFGAYLLFVQWARLGAQQVSGHVESEFLSWGATPEAAEAMVNALTLEQAQATLDALIISRDGDNSRRWWDAMRDEPDDRS